MKLHAEETAERSGVTALVWVIQMAHRLPIVLTSNDVFPQIQSDSAWVSCDELLTLQVPDSWTSGRQTDLHAEGTSLSVIPAAKQDDAARTTIERME